MAYEKYGQPGPGLMVSDTNQLLGFIWGKLDLLAGGGGAAGLATETTLSAVLSTLQSQREYEGSYVIDTGNSNAVLQMIVTYDEDSGTFSSPIYKDASFVTVVPVGPLVYLNNITTLTSILTQTTNSATSLALLDDVVHTTDTPYSGTDKAIPFLVRRNDDIGSVMCDTDGDYGVLSATEYGELFVYDQTLDALLTNLAGTDNAASSLQGFNMLGKAVTTASYNPAYADNDAVLPAFDKTTGRLLSSTTIEAGSSLIGIVQSKEIPDATSTYCPSQDNSAAYEASSVSKASAGVLYRASVYNSGATDIVFQIHNTTSVPADASVPDYPVIVPAGVQLILDFGKFGRYYSTGITWCGSTTFPTKTISGSVLWVNLEFA